MGKKEIRRYRRFYGYDYSRGAALFITIVTSPRRRLFGQIVDAKLKKTPLGLAVERRFTEMAQMPGIRLFNFVVMPDHVHLQLHLRAGLPNPLVTLGRAIGAFKSLCAKDFHELTSEAGSLWQQGYHDWICMSEEMIASVNRYIDYNPLKFELRYNQPAFLAIHEPIAARRLSTEEFWRGIGAVDLLDCGTPFIALRISRRLSPRQVSEAVARIRRRAGDYVFVGGWISPGEKAVRDMLLAEPMGRIVQILPSAMPHDYKVGSLWLGAIRDRRAAIIARGNSEIEFSRAACLEVNEAAAGLATQALPAGQRQGLASGQTLPFGQGQGIPCGKAVYWLPEGRRSFPENTACGVLHWHGFCSVRDMKTDMQNRWRMDQNEIALFRQAIEACEDPAEIARKVKLAFKRMQGETALACFAKVMTAELPHPIKVAVWDAVRYSHIWWGVDAVLQGPVMENPIVQQAFADAVPMRRWVVANRLSGWEITQMTVDFHVGMGFDFSRYSPLQVLIHALTSYDDDFLATRCLNALTEKELSFVDCRGNNLLWYLTYRDDQNAAGGFACPKTVAALLERGVDPSRRNNLGLCWNDTARHVVRSEV